MALDRQAILNTFVKSMESGFNKFRDNPSMESAQEFHEIYRDAPLSTILKYARNIIADPYIGLNFFKDIILNKCIPLSYLSGILVTSTNYLSSYGKKMPEEQYLMYSKFVSIVAAKYKSLRHCRVLAELVGDLPEEIYDLVYDDAGFESLDSYGIKYLVPYLYIQLTVANTDVHAIANTLRLIERNIINYCGTTDSTKLVVVGSILRLMLKDSYIAERVEKIPSRNLVLKIYELANVCSDDFIKPNKTVVTLAPVVANVEDAIEMMEAAEELAELTKEADTEEKITDLLQEKNLIETDISEALVDLDAYSTTDVNDALVDAVNTLVSMESPEDSARAALAQKRLDVLTERHIEIVNELESLGFEFAEEGEAVSPFVLNTSDWYTEYNNDGTPSRTISKSTGGNNDKEIGNKNDDDEPEVEINKPKESLTQRAQASATEAHIKTSRKLAEGERKKQSVTNVIRTVAKIPGDIINSFKKDLKAWDDADDNRRKEYIIKPGFRKKWFKTLRNACMYGAAWYINKAWIPVLAIIQMISKQKDKRMINELAAELDTEIKVCEEKINDANTKSDNAKKYELMRMRDKLKQEKTRVTTNSKVI